MGNTKPSSHPGAQSPEPGKGRRAAALRWQPQRRRAGAERKTWCPGPAPGRAEAPPDAPTLGGAPALPPCHGLRGRGGEGPLWHVRPVRARRGAPPGLARSVRVWTVWDFHLAVTALLFFFFFVALLLIFLFLIFLCVCGFFCPSWSQKETAAVSLQQKQRGRSFAGAACGAAWPSRWLGVGGCRRQPGSPRPAPHPTPAQPACRTGAAQSAQRSATARGAVPGVPHLPQPGSVPGACSSPRRLLSLLRGGRGAAPGLPSVPCPPRPWAEHPLLPRGADEPSAPQPGQRPLGARAGVVEPHGDPTTRLWERGAGGAEGWPRSPRSPGVPGAGAARGPVALGSTRRRAAPGRADGAGEAGGRRDGAA